MKIQALALGKSALPPHTIFSLYQFPSSSTPPDSQPYFICIEDIDTLFFKNQQSLSTKAAAFTDLLRTSPDSFRKDTCGRCYLASSAVIKIARLFHLHILAVLCSLNENEILADIADPLLKIFPHLKSDFVDLPKKTEYEWKPAPITGREWFFVHPDEERPPSPAPSDHSSLVDQAVGRHAQEDETRQSALHHLTGLKSTRRRLWSAPDTRQQQEAIITTRRFQKELTEGKRPPTSVKLLPKRTSKKSKARPLGLTFASTPTAHAGMSAASSPVFPYSARPQLTTPTTALQSGPPTTPRQHQDPEDAPRLFGTHHVMSSPTQPAAHQSRRRLIWPMDKFYDDTPYSCLFKTSFDDQVCLPRLLQKPSTSAHERAETVKRRSYDCRDEKPGLTASFEKHAKLPRLEHCNNLDLLATQATKIRDLPLSPEVSPPPPTLSIKLPPIKHMLSELTGRLNRLEHKAGSQP